jgi:hypothetical protein
MNLVTKENLFIIGFILAVVLGIQYFIYLELKKYTFKEITKRLYYSKQQINKEVIGNKNDKINNVIIEKKNIDNNDNNDNDNDELDTPTDLDSNIDSYVNPLPSVNDNKNDDNDNDDV